ncbi:3-methyl-2-oxobutanoate hydroxymethyltransferase [Anaeromyxobacter oryzae]|uniref:3-methyl-2-oxobutanoate hydroxymethyltransferase n=1 Tax=Anaeromyxobacter oryzae TaxID=2918170 RepID=A0ABN6MS84_9BACT|nr:3-methyl-2-oxobutanoate hydroxymethyltransferase [Anaeromyxobacter oryzae]BDG02594.1 3-methyl-2-oxobutanoate hydroxymethyltransferase [Anaeromyxobacter oryzae]
MSSHTAGPRKHVTVHELRRMKEAGEKIAVVTAYDATAARLVAAAGADVVLVGDSLGMVVQGHDSTLPVTLEQMTYHCAAVRRGLARGDGRAHLVGDLSFGSYQASPDEAVKSAMRLAAEGGVEAVKLEGGAEFGEVIRRIVRAGVPVMGHIGLTPQSVHKMGGYVVQGKDSEKAQQLLKDARALEAAGCYALVLECIPAELARIVSGQLRIPTIGIGAGPHCDGQVLVLNDLLGLDDAFTPKFVKRFGELGAAVKGAVGAYVGEVKARTFPADAHSFHSSAVRLVPVTPENDREEPPDAMGAPI